MPTSNYQPDVKVEIAFNAGYSTATASRTWTDVSAYVELDQGISITYGRADEFTTAEPNHLSLTLDNRDGRFTAGKTGGAYYPNVKIGRPIRVTSTPVGGSASVRFLGYVEEWPVSWDGTDATAYAQITALSRMARLGLNAPLRSVVAEEILSSNPIAYYPLNEAEGSVLAADAVGGASLQVKTGGTLNQPVTFGSNVRLVGDPGTGMGVPGSSTFDGSYLFGTANIPGAYPFTVSLETFVTDSAGSTATFNSGLVRLGGSGGGLSLTYGPGFTYGSGFTLSYTDPTTFGGVSGGVTRSGPVHVCGELVMTAATTGTLNLYYNGALVATGALTSMTPLTFTQVLVGSSSADACEVSHVTIGRGATGVAARATAGLTGFNGESAGARVQRLARYSGVLSNEVDGGTGSQAVVAIDTTGATALDTMRRIEAVEDGVLHDSRSNVLTLNSRQSRFHTTSAFSLAASQVEADISPKLDRSTLTNDVTATAIDGSSQRVSDATSIANYGYARQTPDVAGTTRDAIALASWAVLRFAEPLSRIPNLGVDLLPLNLATQTLLMSAHVGTRFTVSALPAQAPASSLDFFVEGYTETIGPESYRFVFNVSPVDASTDLPFWILEDATYGIYDARPIAL